MFENKPCEPQVARVRHREDPLCGSLKDVQLAHSAAERGDDLELRACEAVQAGNIRVPRHPQHTGRSDQHVEGFVAGRRRDPPLAVPMAGGGDVGTEPDVGSDAAFVGNLPEVPLELGSRRQQVRPAGIGPELNRSSTATARRR